MQGETTHPEFASEQEFLRHAAQCLHRMREKLPRDGAAGADPKAAAVLKEHFEKARERLEHPDTVVFGRIIFANGDDFYLGPLGIQDDDDDLIVVNWAAPAAKPFYEASSTDPAGLTLRRRLRTRRDQLLGIADEWFGTAAIEPTIGDILLDELTRERTAEMQQVVATIQADQYRIMERPLDSPTIVQGGPGTGKTIVGLHRAVLLLYRYRQELTTRRVLVIGPNQVFMRYIAHVLPSLGETAVDQVVVDDLLESDLRATRRDDPLVARVKGDERMVEVLRRAAVDRVRPPETAVEFTESGISVSISPDVIADLVRDFDARGRSFNNARLQFRAALQRTVADAYVAECRRLRPGAHTPPLPTRMPDLDRALDRIWPTITAPELVRQLLSSEERIERAGDGILNDAEKRLLYRKPVERLEQVDWSTSDIPLIDEVQELIEPTVRRRGHVIIDEAQDLTPMQLRMIGRRISGDAVTVLGDLAQATGLWSYSTWDEVARHLGLEDTPVVEELIHAYRVPREIMKVALPVLALTAPSITPPVPFRDGEPPVFARVERESRVAETVSRAQDAHLRGGTAAIIAPPSLLGELRSELESSGVEFGDAAHGELVASIELLDPVASKGLEFDHVVLVEPAAIIREVPERQGQRDLYVALTRATRTLTCLHAEPLPWPLGDHPIAATTADKHIPQPESEPASPSSPRTAGAEPIVSVGEALVLARMRGRSMAEALAGALLAEASGGSEDEVVRAILDPSVYAEAVASLLEQLRDANRRPVEPGGH